MDRDQALAIALTWLQGPRGKPYITVAQALARLRQEPDMDTIQKLASNLPVSVQIVREFLSLLTLPDHVQQLLESQQLNLDKGKNLARLNKARPDLTIEVANQLVPIPFQRARDIVDYLLRNPEASVEIAIHRVAEDVQRIVDEFNIVAVLDSEQFSVLDAEAKRQGINPNQLVSQIVADWISDHSRGNREPT